MRFGVRIGACGTFGSLPLLVGKGSRGRPLHISFKVDILVSISSRTLKLTPVDQAGDGHVTDTLTAKQSKGWGMATRHSLPHWHIGVLVILALRNPPMVLRRWERMFGNYWSLREFEVARASVGKQHLWTLTPDASTCNYYKVNARTLDGLTNIM